jgi:hypothetical protein
VVVVKEDITEAATAAEEAASLEGARTISTEKQLLYSLLKASVPNALQFQWTIHI